MTARRCSSSTWPCPATSIPAPVQVPGVTLLDMDDLKRFTEDSLHERRREVSRVQGIIMDELERFQTDRTARELTPLVTSLRQRGEAIRNAELDRFRAKLDGLDPEIATRSRP